LRLALFARVTNHEIDQHPEDGDHKQGDGIHGEPRAFPLPLNGLRYLVTIGHYGWTIRGPGGRMPQALPAGRGVCAE
jgi:CxxC motif-containing protein (DUF1111 family)